MLSLSNVVTFAIWFVCIAISLEILYSHGGGYEEYYILSYCACLPIFLPWTYRQKVLPKYRKIITRRHIPEGITFELSWVYLVPKGMGREGMDWINLASASVRTLQWTFDLHQISRISWLDKRLLASWKWLCFLELIEFIWWQSSLSQFQRTFKIVEEGGREIKIMT
jgi:hypothetical protein